MKRIFIFSMVIGFFLLGNPILRASGGEQEPIPADSQTSNSLIGTWRNPLPSGTNEDTEFREDGSVITRGGPGNGTHKYHIIDQDHLEMVFLPSGLRVIYHFTISGNELRMQTVSMQLPGQKKHQALTPPPPETISTKIAMGQQTASATSGATAQAQTKKADSLESAKAQFADGMKKSKGIAITFGSFVTTITTTKVRFEILNAEGDGKPMLVALLFDDSGFRSDISLYCNGDDLRAFREALAGGADKTKKYLKDVYWRVGKYDIGVESEPAPAQLSDRTKPVYDRAKGGTDLERVGTFDLRGVKLGMLPDDVRAVIKQAGVHRANYREQNSAESDWNCAGTGCGMITDWQMEVSLTDEPYGSGVFDIRYKKQVLGSVDMPTFINQLKEDLRTKYGNPTYNVNTKNPFGKPGYFACWGNGCKNGIETKITDPCAQKFPLAVNKLIPRGKYLVVRFDGGDMVCFSLFDINPYYVQDEQRRKNDVERAKQHIKF